MKQQTKGILLIVALVLIMFNFQGFSEDAGSFVPFSIADGFQMSPAAKYVVVTSTQETAQQSNLMFLLGLVILFIIIISGNKQ